MKATKMTTSRGTDKEVVHIYNIILDTCAKLLQSCETLWNLMDCSPPGLLSMGFCRQEDWNGLPFPSPGDLPGPGTEPVSPVSLVLQADSLPVEPSRKPLFIPRDRKNVNC